MTTIEHGKWGERIALGFLEEQGYELLTTSFRCRFGEIDLIVKNERFLVFVEVKTRNNANFAHAREFVNKAKQRKIVSTAKYWLARNPGELQPRFDVIEVYAPDGQRTKSPKVNHIENAFGA